MREETGVQLFDFDASFLTYITREQANHGMFQIACICTVHDAEGRTCYYLTHAVAACDVYGTGRLIKEPSYRFQALFTNTRYRIFRTFMKDQRQDDSAGMVENLFQGLELNARQRRAVELRTGQEIVSFARSGGKLGCRIVLEPERRRKVEIEFPVRHINLDPANNRFQVETGTVVVPVEGKSSMDDFSICYIAFNTLDSFDAIAIPSSQVFTKAGAIHLYGYEAQQA